MKLTSLAIIPLIFWSFNLQEKNLLLEQKVISDLASYPIYPYLINIIDKDTVWKDEYRYLDSIDIYEITYLSEGLKIKGFLVKPNKTGNFPCIIFNRGGNRDFGNLKVSTSAIALGQIAKEGYVVIASQYRGNGGSEGIEEFGGSEVADILILTDVLKEIEGADTTRIGMLGWSRGGMMTYIALSKTRKIKAAVVGGAVSDLFEIIKERSEMETNVIAELIPQYENQRYKELTKRSAIKWVDTFNKDVPILMLHGNSDWRVKPEQSLKLALEFEKFRIPYKLIVFEGGDHGITEHKEEVHHQIISWFDKYVKNKEALPNMDYHGK